jgi:hypothetical protein
MSQEEIDLQNDWEDRLERDALPKFKFPINFLTDEFDLINLDFKSPEIRDPEPAKKIVVKTVKLEKKTKGGLF